MNNISHYVLWGADNESYWIPGVKDKKYCCVECGSKLSRHIINDKFYLIKKNYDVSFTFDGFLIGSQKFLSILSELSLEGYSANKINQDPRYKTNYFKIEFNKIIHIDCLKAKPQIGPICKQCGQNKYVVGAHDYYLENSPRLDHGLFRTDLEFGDGFEKSPIIVVGIESAKLLLAAELKGMTLDSV
ncbi:MAG: hypothetical protein NTX45_27140 [Proteobacteria bacterium]|nr:hypothetical protein [Pseudomonadota bacterium]